MVLRRSFRFKSYVRFKLRWKAVPNGLAEQDGREDDSPDRLRREDHLVQVSGFGVWGLGCGVWGLGFRVYGLWFRAWGLGLGV